LVALIVNPKPENALMPLIPGVTINLITFSYFIIPLLIVLTVHEFSHAIAAEIDGIKIKSSGLMGGGIFFVVLYGGFVEIDEFQLESRKVSSKTRLRVASAGIWSNIILAGIFYLLVNNFPAIMSTYYNGEVFQIDQVVPLNQGGFNEYNIMTGDIVTKINGTSVDLNQNRDLTAFLSNKTDLKCSIGDQLVLSVRREGEQKEINRTIILGHRAFIGFAYSKHNETSLIVDKVYNTIIGGNNEGKIFPGLIITKIMNIPINYSNYDQTLEYYLQHNIPNYKVILTDINNIDYLVDVNFFPAVAGSHALYNVFTGLIFENISSNSVNITNVLKNATENGINEGNIPESTIITHVNGIPINISTVSFKQFIMDSINPQPGVYMIFTDINGQNYTINTAEIPVIPVYVGITTKSYWLERNFIGKILGPTFPNWLEIEMVFTWIVSFSVALFNLLPVSIFDGGRLFKEVIHRIIGSDIKPKVKKKQHYMYDSKDGAIQHLMTHNIYEVEAVSKLIQNYEKSPMSNVNNVENSTRSDAELESLPKVPLNFTPLDTTGNGFIDSIQFTPDQIPNSKDILEVDFIADVDQLEAKKKRAMSIVSWTIGGIIIANFLLSMIKLGTGIFWI
jgi:membrane-associated protease RseP (regulator of RpoE activity)